MQLSNGSNPHFAVSLLALPPEHYITRVVALQNLVSRLP